MAEPEGLPPIPDDLLAALTAKQRTFVLAYLQNGRRPAEAYRTAYGDGGSSQTQAANARKLLKHTRIAPLLALVSTRLGVRASMAVESIAPTASEIERLTVTQERVLEEFARVGLSDPRGAVRWGTRVIACAAEGDVTTATEIREAFVEPKDSDELTEAQAAAIAEISMGPKGIKIKFHDKIAALRGLGQHLGMFPQKGLRDINISLSLEAMVAASYKIEGGD